MASKINIVTRERMLTSSSSCGYIGLATRIDLAVVMCEIIVKCVRQ